jgi:outer membrane protein assembly factor BamB
MRSSGYIALVLIAAVHLAKIQAESSWLGFRGDGTNTATGTLPDQITEDGKPKLLWSTPMPGMSVAGVVVIDDLVVTTSSGGQDGEQLFITAVDLKSGETKWQQSFRATGRPYCHPTSANAAPTPVSDGKRIVVLYSSNDVVCLDREGNLLWYRGLALDYPKLGNDIGLASSPVIADGVVIIQVESQGDPMAIGLEMQSGRNLWKLERPEESNWSSPAVIRRGDQSVEVVLTSRDRIDAIDPITGQTKWTLDQSGSSISSATSIAKQLLIPASELVSYKVDGSGQPVEQWRSSAASPQNASPVANTSRVYSLKGSVLLATDLSSGETIWKERLGGLGSTWATPTLAGNRLYVFDQVGKGMVVEDQGDSAKVIEEFELSDGVLGSPAIVDGRLIVRGKRTLFALGK